MVIHCRFGPFLHSVIFYSASPYHKHAVLRMCLICFFSHNILFIVCQSESLVPADVVHLSPAVATPSCCGWRLSSLSCYPRELKWVLVACMYLSTLQKYLGLVCSESALRLATANFSYLIIISLDLTSSIKWDVIDFLMTSGMLLCNILIVASSVIDLQYCVSINLLYMLPSAPAKE